MSQAKKPTMTDNLIHRARETIAEDTRDAGEVFKAALQSRAYLYPIKGLYYFARHRELWKPMMKKLGPLVGTAVSVISFMFTFTYLPQAAVLTLVNGPFALISSILLVLSESATITMVMSRSLFLEDALVDTFDGALLARNKESLVAQGRELKASRGSAGDVMNRLGKVVKTPFARFSPKALFRYVLYLPLNMIPIVGTALYILLQGRRYGPAAHARFFQLKGWSAKQKDEWIEKRRAAYTAFGTPAVLLEMIPVVGIFFSFTNSVGAALWAADLEDAKPEPKTAKLRQDELPEQETGIVGGGQSKKEL